MRQIFRAAYSVCVISAFIVISGVGAEEDNSLEYDDLDTWEAPPEIRNLFPYYLSGFDEENRTIWIADIGRWDVRSIFEEDEDLLDDLNKHVAQALYRYNKSLSLRSTPQNPVTEGVVILDMEGFDIKQLGHAKAVVWFLEKARDVEVASKTMAKGFVLNVDFIAERFLNLLSPVLGPVATDVEVYGTNSEVWIPKLLKQLPKASLPAIYGGSEDFKPVAEYG